MQVWLAILLIVIAAVICGGVGFFVGINHRKKIAEAEIGSAEQEAKRIVSEALKTAEAKKKETILEGKDELHRLRNESEKKLPKEEERFSVRSAEFRTKKKLLTEKLRTLKKRKTRLQRG